MKKPYQPKHLNNENGSAMVETLPILIIFVVLFGYGLGLFSVVHTAIMNSMAARTYTFETLSNRSDVTLFRDRAANGVYDEYRSYGTRFHTVNSELKMTEGAPNTQYATTRELAFGRRVPASKAKESDHNEKIYQLSGRNSGQVEASPAWVMVGYGICIDAQCGD